MSENMPPESADPPDQASRAPSSAESRAPALARGPEAPGDSRTLPAALAARLRETLRRHWPTVKHSRYFAPGLMTAINVGIFFLARVLLFAIHHEDFARLTTGEIMFAFVRGALFDGSISAMYIGLPLLVMMLPFEWAASKWCRRICGWYVFAVVAVFTFVLGGDVVYFGHVHRHAGPETWAVGNDLVILFSAAYRQALVPILLATISLAALGYGWHRLLGIRVDPVGRRWPHGVACFVVFAVFLLTGRGGVTHKPLNIVNAFEGVSVPAGYLALNGPFSLNHSLRSSYLLDIRRYPHEEAVAKVRGLIASPRDTFIDEEYPLLRHRTAPAGTSSGRRPNVIIVLLESWDGLRVDCMRRAMGLEPYGSTPNLDELAERGILFTRFYASGQRSVHAIAAILAGIPTIPGMPYIGLGLEQNRLAYLGRIAKRNGYATYFLQGSPRNSYRCEAISSLAGFDNYYGAEDVPKTGHAVRKDMMGAWDYDLFVKAHEVFSAAAKPFMGLVFTLSTHGPYDLPHDRWERHPPDSRLNGHLNALAYADWALGEFFKRAKEAGYFDETIFVIVSDHVGGGSRIPEDYSTYHLVPLVIAGPGVEPGIRDTIGSQTDLFPTIMDLAGWSARHATVGRSLLDPPGGERFALCLRGEMVVWIDEGAWLLHDLTARRAWHVEGGSNDENAALDLSERRLFATIQVLGEALRKNKVFSPETR